MSSFEPAARMHRPPTVWKNSVTSTTITAVTRPTAGALPPSTSKELGRVEQRYIRAAQHRDIHGIQAAHRQNACENGMDFAVRLQKSGHNTGDRAGQRTGQQPGERMRRRAQHGPRPPCRT